MKHRPTTVGPPSFESFRILLCFCIAHNAALCCDVIADVVDDAIGLLFSLGYRMSPILHRRHNIIVNKF